MLPIHPEPPTTGQTDADTSGGNHPRYVKVLDQDRCIGCHACTTACKSENEVPLSVTRTYVKAVDVGTFPDTRRAFQVTRCNQCEDAPCVDICPTGAMFDRPDGIVDFDKDSCIGCKACMAACPYDAIFINPDDHSAEKCNFCAHRIDVGLEPACVVVCPVEAILVGDLGDPTTRVAHEIGRRPTAVRRPEKGTRPRVHYTGAGQSTLDPLAAQRPDVDIFAWATQHPDSPHHVNSGTPVDPLALRDATVDGSRAHNSSAAAVLTYDIGHAVPWDWRVGLYTWTKSIATGAYVVVATLVLLGLVARDSALWQWAGPAVAVVFLAVTGAILVADLEHPGRFHYLVTRGRWQSWLVRGAAILGVFGLVLAGHMLLSLVGGEGVQAALAVVGIPAALLAACYTAFLFAQASARDLWQSPLLPPHLAVQAVVAGAAAMLPLAAWLDPMAQPVIRVVLAGAVGVHLVLVAGEVALPHPTAHGRAAMRSLTHGRFASTFRLGLGLVAVGLVAPWSGPVAGLVAVLVLAGLLAHEHVHVQAGQSVPLA